MQFLSTLLAFAAVLTTISATPAESKLFRIKTKSISGHRPSYNGLYMSSTHTGAGLSAPTFHERGGLFHFNGSSLVHHVTKDANFYIRFGRLEDGYSGWGYMTLNVGDHPSHLSEGFMVNEEGYIVYAPEKLGVHHPVGWTGWRVCNWVHGVPELYWNTGLNDAVPCNCEIVHLVPEYI